MARDIFHPNVREALEKDGWKITADPLRINIEETHLEIDLAAENLVYCRTGWRKNRRRSEKFSQQVADFGFSRSHGAVS